MNLGDALQGYALIKKSTLTDIGDIIRENSDSNELIPLSEMGKNIKKIINATQGGLINGFKYTSGTFSFDTDQIEGISVEHENVGNPIAIFVFVNDPPFENMEMELRYRAGGYYINSSFLGKDFEKSGALVVSAMRFAVSTGASGGRYAINILSDTQFSFGCDNFYPLRGGLVYNWIMLGDGNV